MATKKKLLQAAAGNAGGAALDVDEVFSTYLYTGTNAVQTITNNIDLTEGGLVWTKNRDNSANEIDHQLMDSENGSFQQILESNSTNANFGTFQWITPKSYGFDLSTASRVNQSGATYASWTFRKAEKFFDVVTYTGNGPSNTQNISHNLGSTPGMLVVKATSTTDNWHTWHRGFGDNGYIMLNSTNAKSTYADLWDDTAPTDTHFTVSDSCNTNNVTYVAYLFAHNDGDGEFGADGNADIIKCGSYTGNGSSNGPEIDLGFEPQWLLTKRTNSGSSWQLVDVMRGMSSAYYRLFPDTSSAEDYEGDGVMPTATGFKLTGSQAQHNASGGNYIYIAIRRGPLAPPETATEVFDISHAITTNDAPFPVDFMLSKIMSGANGYARDRLRGGTKYLLTDTTNADLSGGDVGFDDMTGTKSSSWGTSFIHYNWKRAPNFCDVVAYTGTGTSNQTLKHNLGVVPEMMWVKRRNGGSSWLVYHKGLNVNGDGRPETDTIDFTNSAAFDYLNAWFDTAPTDTEFTVGTYNNVTNNGNTFIAYLFATLAGVSKVGSYTGNGSTQTIDCGFTSGARFILIKRTDSTGDWYVWDTERGIVAGNDPHLSLNTTAAEVTTDDSIDPVSSGFAVNQVAATNINVSSATYIFYAIA